MTTSSRVMCYLFIEDVLSRHTATRFIASRCRVQMPCVFTTGICGRDHGRMLRWHVSPRVMPALTAVRR